MRKDVLEEFVEAAQLGRKRHVLEMGMRSHREPRDPLTVCRVEVHAFVSMIKTRPRARKRGWWDRPRCPESKWRKP